MSPATSEGKTAGEGSAEGALAEGTACAAPLEASRPGPAAAEGRQPRINDFAFKMATVNGTGSASANGLLLKTLYRMGIPCTGKNVFPSNIQGLPTWYEIRVSREGFTARIPRFDLMVAMNPNTYARDVAEVEPGGWILYDDSWPLPRELVRDDVTLLGIPLARLCVDAFAGARERVLMKNIAYVGALAALLDMDMDVIEGLIRETYGRKQHLMDSNFTALAIGLDHVREHFPCPLPLRLEAMDRLGDYVIMDGNTAAALGCVYAGATVGAWYPITPATSLMDNFQGFCRRYRRGRSKGDGVAGGKGNVAGEKDGVAGEKGSAAGEKGSGAGGETGAGNRYVILQAEDELSAAGMVIGAGWMGARAFTPTSGPGISLMSEFIGLAYYAEIPCVFFDVQRTGPSTGMPTRTQQADLMTVVYASHGDTKHIALFPANPGECFDLSVAAFDLAERFQTPVFVLSDLDIGMNDWMTPRLQWDDAHRPDRGKVLTAEELEGMEAFHRYLDPDGDGVPWRTLPGVHPKGAYFTRGSGHDARGRYTEDAAGYVEVVDRLVRKLKTAAEAVPAPVVEVAEGAGGAEDPDGREEPLVAILTIGACDAACREAIHVLAREGRRCSYMRVRAFPFGSEVEAFLASHDTVFVVEQNRDAQLRSLLLLETAARKEQLVSVRDYGGVPMSADTVLEGVRPHLELGAGAETDAPTATEAAS